MKQKGLVVMRPQWYKFEERMPTKKDGDKGGNVLVWGDTTGYTLQKWNASLFSGGVYQYWADVRSIIIAPPGVTKERI